MDTSATVAEHFASAFLANNWAELRSQLADDVAFRALSPPRVTALNDADAAVEVMSSWFDDDESVIRIEAVDTESMSIKERATYRFRTRVESSGKSYRIEQHVFLTPDGEGRIGKLDLICSGWVQMAP